MKMRMHEFTDPEDNFIITAPTYKIMKQSSLPAFLRLMNGYGQYNKTDAVFEMYNGGKCWMRTGTDPDSIVGIPNVRHIWGDEAGLYSLYFWENIQARAASKEAQIDLTTSPYALNWVYKDLIKGVRAGVRSDVEYIKARSNENPYFPQAEYERRRATMDERRFRMVFGGEFERMEGLVYDIFTEETHVVEPFELKDASFFGGIDWGYTNPFAMVVHGILPSSYRFQVDEIYKARLTLTEIGKLCLEAKEKWGIQRFYADPSQPGSIEYLNRLGVPTVAANNDIRVGIDTTYELLKSHYFKFFKGSSPNTIDEFDTYHYPDPKDVKPDQDDKERKPVDQNNHACLAGHTLVITPKGEKRIDEIKAGDEVLTPLGFKRVVNAGMTGYRRTVKLKVKGKIIEATGDHPFYVPLRGFITLDTIRYGDIIPVWKRRKTTSYLINRSIVGTACTIARLVDALRAEKGYMSRFGKRISVLFQKDFISTIRTTIQEITTYQTWKLYQKKSTAPFTAKIYPMRSESEELRGLSKLGQRLKLGIQARMACGGTEKTDLELGKRRKKSKNPASNVELLSKQSLVTPDFVRTIVSRLTDVRLGPTILKEYVSSALRNFLPINIIKRNPAPRLAKESSYQEQSVFNITVEGASCFYADGFLVSNCDAIRYLIMGTHRNHVKISPKVPGRKKIKTEKDRIEALMKKPSPVY